MNDRLAEIAENVGIAATWVTGARAAKLRSYADELHELAGQERVEQPGPVEPGVLIPQEGDSAEQT